MRDGALQPDVVSLAGDGRIVVGIGIAHRGDELILQTLHERLVVVGNAIKLHGRVLQQVIRQLERSHAMVTGGGGLKLIGGIPTEREHLEEASTVHLIRIEAEGGRSGEIQIPLAQSREEQSGEGERRTQSQLIAVDLRSSRIQFVARLPLVRTSQFHAEGLTSTKHVALGHAKDGTGANLVVALGGDVQLQLPIQRQVIYGIDAQVERILPPHRVTGDILKLRVAEGT